MYNHKYIRMYDMYLCFTTNFLNVMRFYQNSLQQLRNTSQEIFWHYAKKKKQYNTILYLSINGYFDSIMKITHRNTLSKVTLFYNVTLSVNIPWKKIIQYLIPIHLFFIFFNYHFIQIIIILNIKTMRNTC